MSQKKQQINSTINKKIAIIAGSGELPLLIANTLKDAKASFINIFMDNKNIDQDDVDTYHLQLGQIGKTLTILKENNIKEIVFAGYFNRPHNLFDLKLDITGIRWATKLALGGNLSDDKLLRTLTSMMEEEGFKVISPKSILEQSCNTAKEGIYTKTKPNKNDLNDIERGKSVLNSLSSHDIGQAIIVENNMILGIEAVEGTDELIKRVANYKLHKPGNGVLVKMTKTTQDERLDLPTIGKKTIENIIKSGIKGIAIESNKTIFMDKDEVIKIADQNNIFIYAF